MSKPRGWLGWDVVLVLVAGWAVRGAYLLAKPSSAASIDARSWEKVAEVLRAGGNPYVATSYLNHPPFWVGWIYGMSWVAGATGWPFHCVLWGTLIAAESVAVVLTFRLMSMVGSPQDSGARRWVVMLLGAALNPAMVFQVCQHGNFDVVMMAWVLLALIWMVRFGETGRARDWLIACGFLGVGALAKTVPLALVPLLAIGARGLPRRVVGLGAGLALGPILVGVGAIYALSPEAVVEHVIRYRSFAGWYGVTGLMELAGAGNAGVERYGAVFSCAMLAWVVLGTAWLWRKGGASGRWVVLLAGVVMLGIPTLGPGYGAQYIWWYWPLLLVSFSAYRDKGWRGRLAVAAIVMAATYVVDYTMMSSHGGWVRTEHRHWWDEKGSQTLVRVPEFGACLIVLLAGMRLLGKGERAAELGDR